MCVSQPSHGLGHCLIGTARSKVKVSLFDDSYLLTNYQAKSRTTIICTFEYFMNLGRLREIGNKSDSRSDMRPVTCCVWLTLGSKVRK